MRADGFTIIELLVVVSILSAVAYVALDALKEDTSQIRYDDTANRLTSIRQAILGRPERTLMGEAEISGYVADMGTLPASILDLLRDPCQNTTAGACGWQFENGISYGWRGPYLNALSVGGTQSYRDGWSNVAAVALEDADNFGWHMANCRIAGGSPVDCDDATVTIPGRSNLQLSISSGGRNNALSATDTGYDLDNSEDFLLTDYSFRYFTVEFTNNSSSDITSQNLCLSFSIPEIDDQGTAADTSDDEYQLTRITSSDSDRSATAVRASLTVATGDTTSVTFDFFGTSVPWGIRNYQLFDSSPGGVCETATPYAGHTETKIRLIPRTAHPTMSHTIN